jgi:4-amino-4-deoxy-L-arabinose transferase-like glycosyltransferase
VLTRWDVFLIAGFCLLLFGFGAFSGRPLTMHEARLAQTAREMAVNKDYLLPHSGGRPWLERPPLPHWVVIGFDKVFGHHDRVIVARLPSAICGTLIVLLCLWMTNKWFGRSTAMLSALILATCKEFWLYSSLAEDDIYLALLVALAMVIFVRCEWSNDQRPYASRTNPFGSRAWLILLLFVIAGLTNITKGLLLGMITIGVAIGSFLLMDLDAERLLRYTWVWGWLAMLGIGAVWPVIAVLHYPDVIENWKFDYLGRLSDGYMGQPFYYYVQALIECLAIWTPAAILGLAVTWKRVRNHPHSPERLIWSWAIVPILVFSIPKGKHHHYLVPLVMPWAIISAFGLQWFWVKVKAKWPDLNGAMAMRNLAILLMVVLGVVEYLLASRFEGTYYDTKFIREANTRVPAGKTLFINADVGSLDFFRLQFHSRPDAILLHNLTFLRDEKITAPDVYVVTRAKDEPLLRQYGDVSNETQSPQSHNEGGPQGRFTLFHLTFRSDLLRYPAPEKITNMQGLLRTPGPFCGPQPVTRQPVPPVK